MHRRILILTSLLSAMTLGLAGCEVKETQEGSVKLPRYEVKKTEEGQVTPPKYEVKPAEVKIGQTQKEVSVPEIHTEKKTITVPKIEVSPSPEKNNSDAKSDADKQGQR